MSVTPAILVFAACMLAGGGAFADSAVGTDNAQGNVLNPAGGDPTLERDRRGMSLLIPGPSRTPSGFLYESPYGIRPMISLAGGWNYRLSAELGALTVNPADHGARFRNYGDLRSGVLLNYFSFGLERPGSAHYFDVTAGAAGRSDQYYRATIGRFGDFRAQLFFSELPKNFTDQARTMFQGAGSGSLTLPGGLVPGNNSPAQIASALQAASPFDLRFARKNAGVEVDATPDVHWRFYARYSQERKTGARPFGGAASYPGVPAVETIEPIDYRTHNLLAGAQWVSDAFQANLSYSGSLFRNGIDTLTWEYPLTVDAANAAVLQRGRIDLYPDNASHNVKLDLSAALPLRGRISGSLSWTRMSQDDRLQAPVVNSGILGGAPSVDLANWNTTAALSQQSAGARFESRLMQLTGSFAPLRDLTVQARLRRYEENNDTRYTAFNPLTGQFGYVALDGGVNNILPAFLRAQVRSIPFASRRDNHGVEGDYRLLRRTNVSLGYERERTTYEHRETGKTAEERIRLALTNRDIAWASVRLSYEYAKRSGEGYDFDPNKAFYSAIALLNAPPTLAQLRKYDVADRAHRLARARVNFLLAPDMDLAVTGKYLSNIYGAEYGRLGDQVRALNIEWNWQPNPKATAYAHYGFERMRSRMAQISDDPGGLASGDPAAGGAAYPIANRWHEESRDDAHTLGMGFRYAFARATLESAYSLTHSPYRTRYSFASGGAVVGGAAAAASAGSSMPDLLFRQQTLETSLKLALDKDTALRLVHRYERARFKDWHYDGLPLVFENGAGVFLGSGPRDYSAHTVGVFLHYAP